MLQSAESDWHAVCAAPSARAKENDEFSAASDFKRRNSGRVKPGERGAKLTAAERSQRLQRAGRNFKRAESDGADRMK